MKVCNLVSAIAVVAAGAMSAAPAGAQGTQWYVSPTGSATNSGTISSPLNLTTALGESSPAKPGDTIWLRGGTYKQIVYSRLQGTSAAPIKVAQYPGERAILDGNNPQSINDGYVLYVMGGYTWFIGFEITSSVVNRIDTGAPNQPAGIFVGTSQSIKFINLVVHDMPGQGIGAWSYGTNTEIYGCLVYHNGLSPNFDHGVYAQNQTGTKRVVNNIIFRQASHGIHAYGSSDAYLDNIELEGNTVFENGAITNASTRNILLGGGAVAANPVVRSNYTYYRDSSGNNNIGYAAGTSNAIVTGNIFVAGNVAIRVNTYSNLNVTQNLFVGPLDPTDFKTRYPSNSFMASRPSSGLSVYVRPNQYETGRANITIYNWSGAPSVSVSLANTGLVSGDQFEVLDAMNFFGEPVVSGTYSGANVSVPMANLDAVAPHGDSLIDAPHTAPYFGAFVVRKQSGSTSGSDTTAPTVAMTSPAGGTVSGTVTLGASASDDVGVVGVQFKVNGANVGGEDTSAPYAVSWNTASVANGAYNITAVARDAAGNSKTSSQVSVTVNNTDTTLPTVGITSPTSGATLSGNVTLAASASDNVGVVGVQFKVNGANVGGEDTSAPYAVSWNSASLANGTHGITAVARDAAGNTRTSSQVSVTVSNSSTDTTLPTVGVTSPASGATLSGNVTLAASASDNVGVAGVQFLVDGQPVGSEDTSAPYSLSFDTKTKSNGSHTIAARARDAAGNTRTSTALSVSFSNTSSTTGWKLYYEAESARLTSPMTKKSHSGASKGKYVSSATAEKGVVSLLVNVPSAGTYVLWARVLAPTSSDDSLYVSVDGGAEDIYDVAEQSWSSSWQWRPVVGRNAGGAQIKLNLAAGSHWIRFRGREANTGLDRIMITNSTSTTP